jgi:hypothetical protein
MQARKEGFMMISSGWLFRRVGVDLHWGERYLIVGRFPVFALVGFAVSIVAAAVWLALGL